LMKFSSKSYIGEDNWSELTVNFLNGFIFFLKTTL